MTNRRFAAIGIDADDTLWHNEPLYQEAQTILVELLATRLDERRTRTRLLATEQRNVGAYGYGIKSFVLSMIEVAVEAHDGVVPSPILARILELGREMIDAPVELLPGVEKALQRLAATYPLWLITKGDLRDQWAKLERSRLVSLFAHVDVVSEKTEAVYADLLRRRGVPPSRFVMVGNSPRSDIEPVVAIGATAVLIPYHVLWEHEDGALDLEGDSQTHTTVEFRDLPRLIERIERIERARAAEA